jgi:hypothetical protein
LKFRKGLLLQAICCALSIRLDTEQIPMNMKTKGGFILMFGLLTLNMNGQVSGKHKKEALTGSDKYLNNNCYDS